MDDKVDKLKAFLWERKQHLFKIEQFAKGKAKDAIGNQLQDVDLIFQYLSSTQTEEEAMEKLKLSLDDQLIPLEELKPRQRENRIAEAIIEFVKTIPPGLSRPINQPGISVRTVLTQVYALKEKGLLPPEIMAISRDGGKRGFIGRQKTEQPTVESRVTITKGSDQNYEKEVTNQKSKRSY